jgi:hypothetical protein
LVPRSSSTPVAAWAWPTSVVSRRRVLEAVFVLLEPPSPSRRIFISSHSLPPLWFAVSVLQPPARWRWKGQSDDTPSCGGGGSGQRVGGGDGGHVASDPRAPLPSPSPSQHTAAQCAAEAKPAQQASLLADLLPVAHLHACSSCVARVNDPLPQLPLRAASVSPKLKPTAATCDSVSLSAEQLQKH